uniref:FAD-binding monooxygenase n=1 Tax=uncultured bacterium UPO68_UPO87 TaxID=1776988 RepID=A0A126T0P2_9BACT|nr:FAD-binding monooxygenase [uncultured bacterium UPO68_UPO87]
MKKAASIVATVAGPEGAYEVAARFMVGCDGGNSVVRRVAGIALDDLGFDGPWLVIDTVLKNGVTRLSTIGLQHCDPSRPVTSMPMAPGRHRWEFMLMPGETAEEVMGDAKLAAMLAPFADPPRSRSNAAPSTAFMRSSRGGGARAVLFLRAMPRIRCRLSWGRGFAPACATRLTSPGKSRRCCAAGRAMRCSTATSPSASPMSA